MKREMDIKDYFNSLNKEIDEISEKINKMSDKFDKKLNNLNVRAEDIDKRLAQIEGVNSEEDIDEGRKESKIYSIVVAIISIAAIGIVMFLIANYGH